MKNSTSRIPRLTLLTLLILLCLALLQAQIAGPLTSAGPAAQTADLILTNGRIYTVDSAQPLVSAVAIRDGKILAVGTDSLIQALAGPATQRLDLAGKFAMPGASDSHVHILEAFHVAAGTCALPSGLPLNQYIPIVQQCAPNQVGTDWVLGFGHSIFDMHQDLEAGAVPRLTLDAAVPDKPVAIIEETSHSVWVNTLALQELGFDAATPDPQGGAILRDPGTGEPNGILLDAAGEMAMDMALLPNATLEAMNYQALLEGLAFANSQGITSLADARSYWKRGYNEAWTRARDEGELSVRAIVGLWAYPYIADDNEQIADLISMYDNDPDSLLRFSQVKLYADGELSHTTAAMLDPYDPDPFFFEDTLTDPNGLDYFPPQRLTQYVTQLEAAGFDMHIHAIGDRGVHQALDAIEAAGIANGGSTVPRHRLTHVSMVQPADVPRFAALDVTADFQVLPQSDFNFFYSIYLSSGLIPQRGQRMRALYDAGARVVLSSDYDVGELSPFAKMETALTMGAQSLPDIHAAIRAYTIEPAYLMRQENRVGSIEVGKLADLIVLDRDITNIPAGQLSETKVLWTLLEGVEVWRAPTFCPPVPGEPYLQLDQPSGSGPAIAWDADSAAALYEVFAAPAFPLVVPPSFASLGTTTVPGYAPDESADGPAGAYYLVTAANSCGESP